METYLLIIDQTDMPSGKLYGAFVPDVPGCMVTGTSPESVIAKATTLLRQILLHHIQCAGVLPKAKNLAELSAEYMLAGEELLSAQTMVMMLKVSYTLSCSVHQIATAA